MKSFAIVFYESDRSGKGRSVYRESFYDSFYNPDNWASLLQPIRVECGKSIYDPEWQFDYFKLNGKDLGDEQFRKHVEALR